MYIIKRTWWVSVEISPSIFCHFFTLVTSLLMEGLLSEADVLAPGVPAFEITKPYLSVITFTGVAATASDVASALSITTVL